MLGHGPLADKLANLTHLEAARSNALASPALRFPLAPRLGSASSYDGVLLHGQHVSQAAPIEELVRRRFAFGPVAIAEQVPTPEPEPTTEPLPEAEPDNMAPPEAAAEPITEYQRQLEAALAEARHVMNDPRSPPAAVAKAMDFMAGRTVPPVERAAPHSERSSKLIEAMQIMTDAEHGTPRTADEILGAVNTLAELAPAEGEDHE